MLVGIVLHIPQSVFWRVVQVKEFGTHCAECLQREPTQESMVIYVTSSASNARAPVAQCYKREPTGHSEAPGSNLDLNFLFPITVVT